MVCRGQGDTGSALPACCAGERQVEWRWHCAPLTEWDGVNPITTPAGAGPTARLFIGTAPRKAGHSRIRSATSSGRPGDVMTWPIPGTTRSTAPGIAAARASP